MSGHRESLPSVTPDQQSVPCKNKRRKNVDNFIKIKETIQEPVNPSKRAKEDTIPDVETISPKEAPSFFST